MENDNEKLKELKKILEPHKSFEDRTELQIKQFIDTDVLAMGMLHKELLKKEDNNEK